MDSNDQYELYLIRTELQSIINELDDIAYGIRRNFTNIGNENAASCVSRVADTYRIAKRKLENMDTSKVTDEYASTHGNVTSGGVGDGR